MRRSLVLLFTFSVVLVITSATLLLSIRPSPIDIPMVTLVSDVRRPSTTLILGSIALRTRTYMFLNGVFIPKKCREYSVECLREDHALILENACTSKAPGIIVKEDDFETCVHPELFYSIISSLGLLNRITILGYGTGLFYVPYSKCESVSRLLRGCTSQPADDCLNNLYETQNRTAHIVPPLAVHRYSATTTSLHKHKCDPLCFTSCWDGGNYRTDYIDAGDWIRKNINASIDIRRPNNFSCNHPEFQTETENCVVER